MRDDTKIMMQRQRGYDHLRAKALGALAAATANHELAKAHPHLAEAAEAVAGAYGRLFELARDAGLELAEHGRTDAFEALIRDYERARAAISDLSLELILADREQRPITKSADV